MALNLKDLTEGERKELLKQMKEEEKEKKQKRNEELKSLNEMTNEVVNKIFSYGEIVLDVLTEFKKEL